MTRTSSGPTRSALRSARHAALVVGIVALGLLSACGGEPPRELAGFVRDPAPTVDTVALPDLSQGGEEFALRAEPDELLVVYFGFTNCPDVCPTTLADLRTALRRMEPGEAERVQLAMVTVDPDRDIPVLVDYAQTFVDGARALATTDDALLRAAAEPFGVSYAVEIDEDGQVEVGHSSQMFVVDDTGTLAVTWQFGIPADDIAADLSQLLRDRTA